jgi:hypothetical protein
MKKEKKVVLTMAIVMTAMFVGWIVIRINKGLTFEYGCDAYIKRAADSNTVDLALENLEIAIDYAERNKLTEGVVSIFFMNPKNDIEFWHRNLVACKEELQNLPADSSQLEQTNVLMKLRESLTDDGESSTKVTVPDGISIYPYNVIFFWWSIISAIGLCVFWIWLIPESWL